MYRVCMTALANTQKAKNICKVVILLQKSELPQMHVLKKVECMNGIKSDQDRSRQDQDGVIACSTPHSCSLAECTVRSTLGGLSS